MPRPGPGRIPAEVVVVVSGAELRAGAGRWAAGSLAVCRIGTRIWAEGRWRVRADWFARERVGCAVLPMVGARASGGDGGRVRAGQRRVPLRRHRVPRWTAEGHRGG